MGWAITRGTTKGESKFIPMTPTDLEMRVSAGRAVMNYVRCAPAASSSSRASTSTSTFRRWWARCAVGEREVEYGYSSGIYVKHVSARTPMRSVPAQEEIDALGGGKTVGDWERASSWPTRSVKDENVTLVGGVAPTAVQFGRYLHAAHGVYPKDLWKTQIMTLGSVPGINTRYAPALHGAVWPGGHPRDLWRHRGHVRPAARRKPRLGAQL